MGKLQTKSDDKLGVKLTGTPEQGQHITLNQDAALQAIFGTQHPESADLRAHRVIICNDGIQWVTKRRKSGGAARPWRALGYYTTRNALIRACALLECEVEPSAMSLLADLPDVIGGAT